MKPKATANKRSLSARIFISSDERRLRAGWRLLVHAILFSTIAIPITFAYLLVQGPPTGDLIIQAIAVTIATWIARRFIDRRTFRSLGFQLDRRTVTDLAFGFALPSLMMALIYLFEWAMGWLRFENWAWNLMPSSQVFASLLSSFVLFMIVGYYEELLSRGYHLQNLVDGINLPWAIFLSSSIFAILHIGNPHASSISTLGILAAGYFLAYGWLRTRRLWLPIGLHIGWNFFEGPIFGFPISGLKTFRLVQHEIEGPPLITGGEFGPEAGLILIPVLAIGVLLIWVYSRHREVTH
jgi:membrane protease YdiL (CAAX protease family)